MEQPDPNGDPFCPLQEQEGACVRMLTSFSLRKLPCRESNVNSCSTPVKRSASAGEGPVLPSTGLGGRCSQCWCHVARRGELGQHQVTRTRTASHPSQESNDQVARPWTPCSRCHSIWLHR